MKMLITAGPTREPIDAVRFISNRSSGRMGGAVAEAAASRGHDVTLLLGPVLASASLGERVRVERFETAADLERLLGEHFPACDALVMAAAVADFRPLTPTRHKIPRSGDRRKTPRGEDEGEGESEGAGGLELKLEPTPDLVAGCAAGRRGDQSVVAFSLEEESSLERRAREKMARKGVDATVANALETMESAEVEAAWLPASGEARRPGRMNKAAFAAWLVERVEELHAERRG